VRKAPSGGKLRGEKVFRFRKTSKSFWKTCAMGKKNKGQFLKKFQRFLVAIGYFF
jgi:hypothetical protein